MMIRISVLSMMFALAVGAAGAQQLPPQPPPVASLMGQGNDQERAACHPDVSGFVKPSCRSILMTCWGFWAVCRRIGPRSAAPASRYWRTTVNKPTPQIKLGLGSGATDQGLLETASEESALGAAVGTR